MYNVSTENTRTEPRRYVAFQGYKCIASGELPTVARAVKEITDTDAYALVLVLDANTGESVELDLRGTIAEVLDRLPPEPEVPIIQPVSSVTDGPGRPKLGVVAREVTLLPRHWEWLNSQPGGASVALRKLVEEARRVNKERDRVRIAKESCYRFMVTMAGNETGFEEATRALFADNRERFMAIVATWHSDIKEHIQKMADITQAEVTQGKV